MDMDTSGGFLHMDDNRQTNPFGGDRGGTENQQDRARNTVHCSVAQIVRGVVPPSGLVLFRQKVQTVIIVGLVTKVNDQNQVKVNYWIEDETGGPLEIQLLRVDDGSTEPPVSIMENTYIRVYGQVKTANADSFEPSRPFVLGFKIEPITNISEVITHSLKIYRDAMLLERISARVLLHQSQPASLNRQVTNDPFHDPIPSHTNGTNSLATSAAAPVAGPRGLDRLQNMVLKSISQDQSGEGISFAQLKENFKVHLNEAKLKEICEFLVNEGHAYNTTDDTHYKSTES